MSSLCLGLALTVLVTSTSAAAGVPPALGGSSVVIGPPSIELGDVIGFPSDSAVLVPVYVTSAEPVRAWQLSVDYDASLVELVGIDFVGTSSESLSPTATPLPAVPPHFGLRVEYPNTAPLPAGQRVLAAFLQFDITWLPGNSSANSVTATIGTGGPEPFPPRIEQPSTVVIPSTTGAMVQLYSGPTLRIEPVKSSAYASFSQSEPIRLNVRAWTSGSTGSFQIGLDYVDLFLNLGGGSSDLVSTTPGSSIDVSLPTAAVPSWTIDLLADAATPFPAQNGDVIAVLELTLSDAWVGGAALSFTPSLTSIDSSPFVNLVDSAIRLEPAFVRGDGNWDGFVTLSDTIHAVNYVVGNAPSACPAASDWNADGVVAVGDVVLGLQYLFTTGPAPSAPFPTPGVDPSSGGLPCGVDYVP